ncbi:MAG: DMT family transporter [Anaerolineales bacterium]|nr:MAG: DMT family transporter [Anaerolineales bacterium]
MTNRRIGIVFGLLAAAIWGGMYVVSKVVLEVVPPFTLLTLRLVLGIASLTVWLSWRHAWPRLSRSHWVRLLAVGILGYGISLGFQFTGTHLSTATNGAVITASTPTFVFLFAWLVLREQIGRRHLLALLLSTVGVLLVIDPFQARFDSQLWLGNILLVGAAATWALYSVLVRRTAQELDPVAFTFVAFLGGLMVTVPAAAFELRVQSIGPLTPAILAGVAYLGLVSTAVAAYLWNKAFTMLPAGTAGLTFFAQPLVGAGLGISLLGDPLTLQFAVGATLILLCLWMAAQPDRIT